MEVTDLVDLVESALSELPYSECPYCHSYIGLDRCLDRADIVKWLGEHTQEVKVARVSVGCNP